MPLHITFLVNRVIWLSSWTVAYFLMSHPGRHVGLCVDATAFRQAGDFL